MGTTGHLGASRAAGALEREVAAVYREHCGPLFRYAAGFRGGSGAAQDAVQEAFLRYFTARAAGKPIEDPAAWLRRVIHNLLVDAVRSAAARAEVGPATAPEARERRPCPETACGHSEFLGRARHALAPRELQCMRLRIEGLGYRQIGELLELRTGTVGALLSRAYKKIRGLEQPAVQAFRAT